MSLPGPGAQRREDSPPPSAPLTPGSLSAVWKGEHPRPPQWLRHPWVPARRPPTAPASHLPTPGTRTSRKPVLKVSRMPRAQGELNPCSCSRYPPRGSPRGSWKPLTPAGSTVLAAAVLCSGTHSRDKRPSWPRLQGVGDTGFQGAHRCVCAPVSALPGNRVPLSHARRMPGTLGVAAPQTQRRL